MFPNINAECARAGMTKSLLAERLGVSYGTLKNWMNGKGEIPASKLIIMSKLFGCSTDYLLGVGPREARTE